MAKVVKLKDKHANPILPITRATVVEMNDGLSLQTAYDAINSTHYTKTEINAAGYLTSFTETDPTVPSYVKGITESDIAYWNAAAQETMLIEIGYDENEDTMVVLSDIEFSDIVDAWNANKRISIIYDYTRYDCLFCQENNRAIFDCTSGEGPNVIYGTAIHILPGKNGLDVIYDEYEIGYDREPTADSNNLMTSGDIYNYVTPFIVAITNENDTYSSSINAKDLYDNYIAKGITVYASEGTIIYTLEYCDTLINYRIWFESPNQRILLSSEYNIRSQTYTHRVNKYDKYDTVVTQNSDKPLTSGAAYTALSSYVSKTELNNASYATTSSLNTTLSSYATSANYDSSAKKIYLKNGTTTLSEIDATDFIKDGMVDTAYVQGSNLVISFNTDAGKEAVNVPIANIFNASNYYTKSEIDNAGYLTSFTETDPTVPSHVKSITEQNITNWNTAHTNSHTHSNKTVIDGIKATDITNWNSKTDNVGTITGITMNGASKGTSGVVDLGNVITSHQSLENYVTKSDLNSASYLQSFTETDPTVPTHVKSITQQNITDWNNKLSTETQLSINQRVTGTGNAITNISVSNHEITLTKGSTFLTSHQDIKTINNNTLVGTGNVTINELPTVSSTDNGKVLQVVNGAWSLVSPVTMYSGTGAPDNSQGNNGDLYMQI